jgi:hypothetical protein
LALLLLAFVLVNSACFWVGRIEERYIFVCEVAFKGILIVVLGLIYTTIESKIAKYKKKLENIRAARRQRFAKK